MTTEFALIKDLQRDNARLQKELVSLRDKLEEMTELRDKGWAMVLAAREVLNAED